jgi:hypothetical protein
MSTTPERRPREKGMLVVRRTDLKAVHAQPVSLRGEKTGPPIPITNGRLNFMLPAYAPASFLLRR